MLDIKNKSVLVIELGSELTNGALYLEELSAAKIWQNRSSIIPAEEVAMKQLNILLVCALLFGFSTSSHAQDVWTPRSYGGGGYLYSVIWTGSQLVSVGDSGAVITSPDGITWTHQNSGVNVRLISVTWTGSLLVAIGKSTVITSVDGITWTTRKKTGLSLTCVTWAGTKLVAVGEKGYSYTSLDGIVWTSNTNTGTESKLNAVTWTGSQVVAVGENAEVLTSPDGINWTVRNSGGIDGPLNSAVWTGKQLVAVGDTGKLITSADGISWTPQNIGTLASFSSIIWTGSELVAVGDSGRVATSSNGVSWTNNNVHLKVDFTSVTWMGSQLVAVGYKYAFGFIPLDGMVMTTPGIGTTNLRTFANEKSGIGLRIMSNTLFAALPSLLQGQPFQISVYGTTGRLWITSEMKRTDQDASISTSTLPNGEYVFVTKGANQVFSKSFHLMR